MASRSNGLTARMRLARVADRLEDERHPLAEEVRYALRLLNSPAEKTTWNTPGPLPTFAAWLNADWRRYMRIERRMLAALVRESDKSAVIRAVADTRHEDKPRRKRSSPTQDEPAGIPGRWTAYIARLFVRRHPHFADRVPMNEAWCERPEAGSIDDLDPWVFDPDPRNVSME